MATNPERQKSLDKKKWIESCNRGQDQSGKMSYCKHCDYGVGTGESAACTISQEKREKDSACATAYNRMMRK